MRMHDSLSKSTLLLPTVTSSVLLLLFCPAPALAGPDYDYGAHPRFMCMPVPLDLDPSCFPMGGGSMGGPSMGGSGPSGSAHHGSTTGAPPPSWWGMTEEAKATILHLRESLVQQKETILDQKETIRELTAKLALCEDLGRHADDHHHGAHSRHGGGHPSYSDHRPHHGTQQGHHGNLAPEVVPHHPLVGGHSNNNNQGKDKHTVAGEVSSSPEQMERMLHSLKDRLENLQKRNTSTNYSSSLRDLLQRKITSLEQQLQRRTAALSSPDHHEDHGHDGGGNHPDDSDHHDGDHHDNDHHDGDHHDGDHHDGDHHHDTHPNDHHDNEGGHEDGSHSDGVHMEEHGDSHADDDDDHHHDDEDDDSDHDDQDEGHHDESHHSNEADSHAFLPRTGYRTSGSRSSFHNNKLEDMLSQLHLAGSSRKNVKSPNAFQIGFPMRTNYMYGRLKKTLLHEIFALTLCLWIKAGVGPGLGTPFSYSAPGQANELVLIEWGNNPMELLIDDKAVSLPLSLSDGKWHHVCVTWSTRDGKWEVFQDGVQRGSGENLSAWHPIKPGGIFILGQEQDTLGGRFDATQSFVGELSDLQMWSNVLTPGDIYSLASCGSHLSGDLIAWSETEVELHGGATKYPFDPCH
ncbi:Neuronal pentraxin-1 [Merluccius polli]|uniref:Neuronal pentraxin-1 n=1 Tax=Merluccius polli TaxID=89951 RepID=A0AA47MFF1_MERPO|nr:Neuronal pentraxin-1 [Merluccius polli]